MKRLLLMLVVALAAAALVAGTGTAGDTKGPPCANIASGDAGYGYNPADSSGTVQATFDLAAPACAEGSYLLEIYDFSTGTNPLATSTLTQAVVGGDPCPTGSTSCVTITYSFAAGSAPSDGVCIVVTTFYKKHSADRGPDSGCYPVAANSAGGKTYS
jgi:hypothetical protein